MKKLRNHILFIAMILIAFSATSCKDDEPIQIRVHNLSNLNFDEVEVLGKNFGRIDAGDFSDYMVFDVAYRALPVTVKIDSKNYSLVVIDYVGETPLDGGRYTLRLNISDISDENSLTQELVRD
jgi:hypothetical protein